MEEEYSEVYSEVLRWYLRYKGGRRTEKAFRGRREIYEIWVWNGRKWKEGGCREYMRYEDTQK